MAHAAAGPAPGCMKDNVWPDSLHMVPMSARRRDFTHPSESLSKPFARVLFCACRSSTIVTFNLYPCNHTVTSPVLESNAFVLRVNLCCAWAAFSTAPSPATQLNAMLQQHKAPLGHQQQQRLQQLKLAPAARSRGLSLAVPRRPLSQQQPLRRGGVNVSASAVAVEESITCDLGGVLHTPNPSMFVNQNTSFIEEFRIRCV
jgi:hypothetical protein